MNGHRHDFGHEFVSESVSKADSDTHTRFFGTSDTVMTSDMEKVNSDEGSGTDMDIDSEVESDTDSVLGKFLTSDSDTRF